MSYGIAVQVAGSFAEAAAAARAALATQGFGVLTEINLQATLKAKIDQDIAPYLILGVCNPALASQGLAVEESLGLLLPCTVVVRQGPESVIVEALDPAVMVTVSGNPALQPTADDATRRLRAALATLTD